MSILNKIRDAEELYGYNDEVNGGDDDDYDSSSSGDGSSSSSDDDDHVEINIFPKMLEIDKITINNNTGLPVKPSSETYEIKRTGKETLLELYDDSTDMCMSRTINFIKTLFVNIILDEINEGKYTKRDEVIKVARTADVAISDLIKRLRRTCSSNRPSETSERVKQNHKELEEISKTIDKLQKRLNELKGHNRTSASQIKQVEEAINFQLDKQNRLTLDMHNSHNDFLRLQPRDESTLSTSLVSLHADTIKEVVKVLSMLKLHKEDIENHTSELYYVLEQDLKNYLK